MKKRVIYFYIQEWVVLSIKMAAQLLEVIFWQPLGYIYNVINILH